MSTTSSRGTIGIIGAGKSGVAIARLALTAGYTVNIASSGPAHETALMTDIVSPGAHAVDLADIGDGADLLLIAVPLRRFRDLPTHLFTGRTVIDVMNYWPPIDGALPDFADTDRPSSAIIQDAIPDAFVVKTFNHLGYHQMDDLPRPEGTADRIALGVAANDSAALTQVTDFVNAVGFTPVSIGRLEDSSILQPETLLFGAALTADELAGHLPAAVH
ncbi:NAD(P)-binding domain-containing protein [uncultured Microbacterium sp.]|uniref:NADPH-dependent F420 reductase n=1 Tax=uncultured Microbacterium sp. TaxID=191216 RepID=UPI0028D8F2BF|nr:NAD(P)-binding domain-containing protein [uncultured Microbacterium sp.]